ncbi:MAG: translation elongation factor Ts [Candidatus Wildermuthbacteria bacterium]|nr:translation elongation factor Ts [Candidatus Wildermuthbacteria bacterium]
MVTIDQIRQLREATEVSLAECKKALEATGGNVAAAKELLKTWGKALAEKKQQREAKEGIIEAYTHGNGKIGVLVEVRCETDFVARSQDFKHLAHEIALQIAGVDPQDVQALLEQEYIRDPSKKIRDLIEEVTAKVGEKILVERFVRFEL